MADSKLSALTALTAVAAGDYIEILDVSDTSMGASGTNKKITRANLLNIGSDVQAWDADLDALAALGSTAGMVSRTGAGAFAVRTITGTTNRITVANGSGASANPTLDVGSDVYTIGGTDVAIGDGGTGASTAAGARSALGVPQDVVPGWGTWTPSFTGWSTNPTGVGRYIQLGNICTIAWSQSTAGTSNSAQKSMTLPVTAATVAGMSWSAPAAARNNGTLLPYPALALISSAGTVVDFGIDWTKVVPSSSGGWTNSGQHSFIAFVLSYQV